MVLNKIPSKYALTILIVRFQHMAKIQKCMGICKMGEDNCIIIYEKRELWGKTDLLVKQPIF